MTANPQGPVRVVPLEPTPEMIDAPRGLIMFFNSMMNQPNWTLGHHAKSGGYGEGYRHLLTEQEKAATHFPKAHQADLIYRAMLAAAPSPAAPEGVGENTAWWNGVIGEGRAHEPSGELRSIKHMHPAMVKPIYEAHKGTAVADVIAGLIFSLAITQNREQFLVQGAPTSGEKKLRNEPTCSRLVLTQRKASQPLPFLLRMGVGRWLI